MLDVMIDALFSSNNLVYNHLAHVHEKIPYYAIRCTFVL